MFFGLFSFGYWLGESGTVLGGAVVSETDEMSWVSFRVELC